MAKESGLGAAFYIGGYDVSGDVVGVNDLGGGPMLLDGSTGIDKLAFERIGGKRDGRTNITTWFNPTAGFAHDRLGNLPTTDVHAQYWHRATSGRPVWCLLGKQANYDGARGEDGSFTFQASIMANAFGGEWCTGLTSGKRTDTTATNGTGVDVASAINAGSAAFGLQAYLQVFAFTGTSVTVKLQESSDNGVGDAWADVTGGAFTAATGITAERIQTGRTQTVERYLRVVTTGTFTNAIFAVAVCRNDLLTSF
jgi:hypothetical protein